MFLREYFFQGLTTWHKTPNHATFFYLCFCWRMISCVVFPSYDELVLEMPGLWLDSPGHDGLAVIMGWGLRVQATACTGASEDNLWVWIRSVYHVGPGDRIQVVNHYRGHHGASELTQEVKSLSPSLMTFLTVLESKLECQELPWHWLQYVFNTNLIWY